MYVYVHLGGVEEMFPARVTIKTPTPRWSVRLPDCQMFSTWFHIHPELPGPCSGPAPVLPLSPNYKHSMTYSTQADDLMLANAAQAVLLGAGTACLLSTCHNLGCLEKKNMLFYVYIKRNAEVSPETLLIGC